MRADRLLSLMLLLQEKKGMTAQQLAVELEVSERTIYRDIEALSFAGIPIYTHPGVSGGVFLDEAYRVSLASLSSSEAQALAVSSRNSGPLADLGMDRAAAGVIFKLLSTLPSAQRDAAERLRQRIFIDPEGWFHTNEPVPFLSALHQAIWEDRAIELAYLRPEGAPSRRRLNPFALVAKANVWYLIGQQADGEMRTFRVSRIQDVAISEVRFQRPESFDLTAYWQTQTRTFEKSLSDGDRPCEVVVRVHPDAVRSLLNDLTGQYQRLEQKDPQAWLRFRITFYSAGAAESRVLSFGSDVEALEPGWFRERIRAQLQAVLALYQPQRLNWKGH